MPAERLDARGVAQIQSEDLEPVAPLLEIGFPRVTQRAVARKARRDDEARAGPQQLDPGLVADLHASPGEQRDPAREVRGLRTLRVVAIGTARTQLVVEVVDERVLLLADVAVSPVLEVCDVGHRFALGRIPGRCEDVRCREHRLGPQRSDPGLAERGLIASDLLGALTTLAGADMLAPRLHVRREDGAGGGTQADALGLGQAVQETGVPRHRLEHPDDGADAGVDVLVIRHGDRPAVTGTGRSGSARAIAWIRANARAATP